MLERWQVFDMKKTPLSGLFTLRRETARLPSKGVTHEFFLIESPHWVNIVPITEKGTIVMVRQHRLGSDRVELEIPGGVVDPEDPDPLFAAKRELVEETGYRSKSWELIGEVSPNPAIHDNRCYTYLARNCLRAEKANPDECESIETVEYPLKEVPRLIETGEIVHALALVGLFWYFIGEGFLGDFKG